MPADGCADSDVRFEPEVDPFRSAETDEDGEDLPEGYRKLASDLFGETDEKREELVAELKEEIEKRGFEVPTRKAFLVKLLRAGGFTVSGAIEVLTNYVRILRECPQYFEDTTGERALAIASMKAHTILPWRDRHGRRVYVYRPGRWNPDEFTFSDCYKLGYMLSELVALEPKTQIAGVTTVTDATGFGFKQFRSFTMNDAVNAAKFVQDSFPLWFRAVHVINAPYLFHFAFNVVKPVLSKAIRESVVFHKDLDSLHAYIDREILPEDLGGDAGPFSNEECIRALADMEGLFAEFKSLKLS